MRYRTLAFKAAAVALGATSYGVFSDPDVNLKQKNYAAADFLVSRLDRSIPSNAVITFEPLEEADHRGISSPLGTAIPEGVGLRLGELGYSVLLDKVAPYNNRSLYPHPSYHGQPQLVLRGAYAVKKTDVDVFLRLFNTQSNKIEAQFDYTMPLSREIKKLAETEPRAFILKK